MLCFEHPAHRETVCHCFYLIQGKEELAKNAVIPSDFSILTKINLRGAKFK